MGATKSKGAAAKKRMSAATGALLGQRTGTFRLAHIRAFAEVLFDEDLHAKHAHDRMNYPEALARHYPIGTVLRRPLRRPLSV